MPDPNAPTPGTENQIDYDRLEERAKERITDDGIRWELCLDPDTILALVKKARQRDRVEKEIEERIKECVDHNRILKDEGQTEACARLTAEWIGLRFALDALRRES